MFGPPAGGGWACRFPAPLVGARQGPRRVAEGDGAGPLGYCFRFWTGSRDPGKDYSGVTFSACGPFGPCVTSKLTDWFSSRERNPVALIAE
ncbi:hypothetical protein Sm713_04410 [Streptomyces sp. TS71-3]|nr:hypothetical protein Sm713_04410 [Streptomyces sp. TS71-3]